MPMAQPTTLALNWYWFFAIHHLQVISHCFPAKVGDGRSHGVGFGSLLHHRGPSRRE